MKEAIEVCGSKVLKNPLKGHCPPKQCPNKFFKLFGNQPFGVPGTPIFTNSGIGQRYTWYTQLIIGWISWKNRRLFRRFSKSFQEVDSSSKWLDLRNMNWEKVDIIDYENFLCLGLNESGFHTCFFLKKLLRSNVTKDACIVDGRDCTTLFYVGLIWNPLRQKSK